MSKKEKTEMTTKEMTDVMLSGPWDIQLLTCDPNDESSWRKNIEYYDEYCEEGEELEPNWDIVWKTFRVRTRPKTDLTAEDVGDWGDYKIAGVVKGGDYAGMGFRSEQTLKERDESIAKRETHNVYHADRFGKPGTWNPDSPMVERPEKKPKQKPKPKTVRVTLKGIV